jgi:hypothetical protein
VCQYLLHRPITLWDSEYGCAPFILKTAEIAADKLIRLRSNLCLWGTPPAYSGKGRPLPWQHSQLQLTPGRVAQAMGGVLAAMGTPAHPPKPRGKSPGWPTGKQRQPRTRYPVVKKGTKKVKKRRLKSN